MNIPENILNTLTDEQKKKVEAAQSPEELLTLAKEAGYEQAELEVIAGNERAISLYKQLGFQEYGILPDNVKYKDGSYADAVWMMKKLC